MAELPSNTDTYEGDDRRKPESFRARLVLVHPAELSTGIALDQPKLVLGRGVDDGAIAHRTVSKAHIECTRDARTGSVSCRDLGSRNGTWISGRPVGDVPRALRNGDVVRLGQVVLVFETASGPRVAESNCTTDEVPGDSWAATKLRLAVDRTAAQHTPALVVGESGVGKESIARAIHRISGRSGPLVTTNCAALSASLIESQLFGHEKGAFTGAARAHDGFFRSAEGGSLLLDEIGELPLDLQPKLLRAVEQGEVQPIGDARTASVDTRVIAATNQNLVEHVERGQFRRDLYARLSLGEVRIPALRERRADIPTWLRILHRRWAERHGHSTDATFELSAEALETVLLAAWPQNLRGLDRLVHALAPDGGDQPVTRQALPDWLLPQGVSSSPAPPSSDDGERPERPDKETLYAKLAELGWNVNAVARHYQRNRKQVYRWMAAFGIELER